MQVNNFWLGHLDTQRKVHIYGGGISGLLVAYRFKKAGIDFTLYEKSDRLGGKLQTTETEHGLVEWAANAIVQSPEVEKLCNDLELQAIPASQGLKRCIYRNGKIKSFPAMSFLEIIKVFKNLFKTIPVGENISLKLALIPLLGEKLCDELLTPIFRGVYATGSENLEIKSVLPDFSNFQGLPYHNFLTTKLKNRNPVKSLSFPGGMQSLVDALAREVKDNCQLNSIEGIRENSLICTDPESAAELIKLRTPQTSNQLKKLTNVPIHSTTYFLNSEVKELKGCFGLLFNEKDSPNVMGILVNHEIFPQNKKKSFSYTVISKNEKFKIEDIPAIGKYKSSVDQIHSSEHSYGLPVYNQTRLIVLEDLKKNKEFAFWGNYTESISLRKIVEIVSGQ